MARGQRAPRKRRLRYYIDNAGEWRWTHYAANGKATADSAEGYTRLIGAQRGWASMRNDELDLVVEVDRG